MTKTLLDSGPLVAFYSTRDRFHKWAFAQFMALPPPLLTCEAVLSEACFLVERNRGRPNVILRAVREGIVQVAIQVQNEVAGLETLMRRYEDSPMSIADACLVRLSEMHPDCRVLTLDSHFTRYRRHGRHVIPLLAPW
ncbi:MAG: type II toxin-antitoxin system VapC family toxin [Verrucomicrobiales bacterium]